jgi:magnesium chelatase accessory protein
VSLAAADTTRPGARPPSPPSAASPSEAPRSRIVELGANRWHLLEMGRGPAVLILHGAGASSHSCRPLMHRLASSFRVLAPDLPGHAGSSFGPSFDPSLPNVAMALGELLGVLEAKPQLVVGHSAGAAVATRLALDGVVSPSLLVGLAPALVPFRGLAAAVLRPAAALLGRSPAAAFLASCFATSDRIDRILRGTGSVLDAVGVESYRRLVERPEHVTGVLTMMARWDIDALYDELPALELPFLLVAGRNDLAVPMPQVQDAARRLRCATLAVVDGAGHLLHEEQPDRISALILQHLDRALHRREAE